MFQLDTRVDQNKLKEVFSLAGKIVECKVQLYKDDCTRRYGRVEYEHPVEALQAICILIKYFCMFAVKFGVIILSLS